LGEAEKLLDRGEYLYFLDDTHWNAEGIRIAAQELAHSEVIAQCHCK